MFNQTAPNPIAKKQNARITRVLLHELVASGSDVPGNESIGIG